MQDITLTSHYYEVSKLEVTMLMFWLSSFGWISVLVDSSTLLFKQVLIIQGFLCYVILTSMLTTGIIVVM